MQILRAILFPFVPLYYAITWFRNKFYDWGLLKSHSFDFPIVSVGNLSTGGTGKTPMVELLAKILRPQYRIAILSRGYLRKSKGFLLAAEHHTVQDLGDEPFQYHSKYNDVVVAVDEDRRNGIKTLQNLKPKVQAIMLDDAFQHRRVKPGLQILLTPYDNLYVDDIVLPTGNLREPKSGGVRANIVIVTKCPPTISIQERTDIGQRLSLNDNQHLFFSVIEYSDEIFNGKGSKPLSYVKKKDFTLVTGIANPLPLVNYLKEEGHTFIHQKFSDHHNFSTNEIEALREKKLILTTEKDFMRLRTNLSENQLFYLPIESKILDDDHKLEKLIVDYVKSYSMGAAEF